MADGDLASSFRAKANHMKNWKPSSAPSVSLLFFDVGGLLVCIYFKSIFELELKRMFNQQLFSLRLLIIICQCLF